MSPAAGEIVLAGRYRLVEPLATGGMGTVWRAYDDVLDRAVAVKEVLLPPGLDAEERHVLRRRTLREARSAAKLRHSAIVTIFDVVEQDDRPWIVMELVPSQSLDQRIRSRGPVPPSEAAAIGLRVLDALVTAQAAGVQHRDIKPANVLLADDGRVVLTDFGIARHVGDETLTSAGLLVGSPNFLAPERARGLDSPGMQADLWSLGATLYAAVEGKPPFERNGPLPTLAAVVMDEPPPPRLAGPLRPVIDGLLVKNPMYRLDADRTRSMLQQVLRPGLAAAGPAMPVPAAPIGPPPDPTRPLPRMSAAGTVQPEPTVAAPQAPGETRTGGAGAAAGGSPVGTPPATRPAASALPPSDTPAAETPAEAAPAAETPAAETPAAETLAEAAPAAEDGPVETAGEAVKPTPPAATSAEAHPAAGRSGQATEETSRTRAPATSAEAEAAAGRAAAAEDVSRARTVGGGAALVPPATSAAAGAAGAAGAAAAAAAARAAGAAAGPAAPATEDAGPAETAGTDPTHPPAATPTADRATAADDASPAPTADGGHAAAPSTDPAGAAATARADSAPAPPAARTAAGGPTPAWIAAAAGRRSQDLRRALLVAAVLAVVAVVAAVLLPRALDRPDQATPAPSAAPSQPGGATATEQGAATATATASPSTAATSTPTSTPTSTAPTPSAPAAVPAGFTRYRDPRAGFQFQVAVPTGWRPIRHDTRVDFDDPNSGRFLRIDTTDTPQADPYVNWVNYERQYRQGKTDYQNLGIRRVSYGADKGWTCADWEFRIGGTHVLDRNVRVSSRRAHAIYWSTPESLWNTAESRRIFQVATATFVPAPVG